MVAAAIDGVSTRTSKISTMRRTLPAAYRSRAQPAGQTARRSERRRATRDERASAET
jgi:hypothetical protein